MLRPVTTCHHLGPDGVAAPLLVAGDVVAGPAAAPPELVLGLAGQVGVVEPLRQAGRAEQEEGGPLHAGYCRPGVQWRDI